LCLRHPSAAQNQPDREDTHQTPDNRGTHGQSLQNL
jgi:hypothetical protein